MWFRINLIDDSGLIEGLASMLCFAGIMVIAFVDLVRNRGRLLGEQAYPSVSINSPEPTNDLSGRQIIPTTAPQLGLKFYIAIVVPLLMIPISMMIPDLLDWCIHPAFRTCVEVSKATYIFMLFLPCATALLLMGMGYNQSGTRHNDVYAGARISAIDELIRARKEARELRDFAKADEIRDQLARVDIILEDGNDGTTINSWSHARGPASMPYLVPGDEPGFENTLLYYPCTVSNPTMQNGGVGGEVEIYNWDGDLLWEYQVSDNTYQHHHDIEPLPNGNILILAWERKYSSENQS